MTRRSRFVLLTVSVVIGYSAAVTIGTPNGIEPSATPVPVATAPPNSTTTTAAGAPTTTALPRADGIYLVWSTGGLAPGLVAGLEAEFEDVSIVKGDVAALDIGDEVIPLDALAIDPDAHAFFDTEGLLEPLGEGGVALGESSARLRGVEVGDSLALGDRLYTITAIVPDHLVGAAEVVFFSGDVGSPVTTDRFALIRSDLERSAFEALVREMYQGPAPLRIRAEGETPWLRHGDAVLPQVLIKEALGEFSVGRLGGDHFTQDEEFRSTQIITAQVPIIGAVTCHRVVVAMLQGAMRQLLEEGFGHLVDPTGFAGCWNPRFIRSVTGAPSGISRHAWGAAVDINATANPVGSAGSQHPRLVQVMADWGFTWGGEWLVPDPMHFEYAIDPG